MNSGFRISGLSLLVSRLRRAWWARSACFPFRGVSRTKIPKFSSFMWYLPKHRQRHFGSMCMLYTERCKLRNNSSSIPRRQLSVIVLTCMTIFQCLNCASNQENLTNHIQGKDWEHVLRRTASHPIALKRPSPYTYSKVRNLQCSECSARIRNEFFGCSDCIESYLMVSISMVLAT